MKILNDAKVREMKEKTTNDLLELIRSSYENGYNQGRQDERMERSIEAVKKMSRPVETAQEKRDRIVEQAKADVDKLKRHGIDLAESTIGNETHQKRFYHVEFVVNRKKRTVVALVKDKFGSGQIFEKGIAKCAPGDCFNVHIGEAISLNRALGLAVPDDYIFAPQPTKVLIGDWVKSLNLGMTTVVKRKGTVRLAQADLDNGEVKIIDDSRDE